jgi:hypothetical protein
MKLKNLIMVGVVVPLLLVVSIFLVYPNIQTNKALDLDEYISITVNNEISNSETNDYAKYEVSIYEYNLQREEMIEVFRFPQNSGYALGVYDKKSNSVYYTKEKNNNTFERQRSGDQIYKYNLDSDTEIMLTEDLVAVNNLFPVDDTIFFVGARQNNADSLVLGKISLTNGVIEYWDESDTLSVETISIDRINKRIYVAVYDRTERDNAVSLFNSGESPHPVAFKHSIYSFDYNLNDKQEVLSKDDMRIYSVYARDNRLLYGAHDSTVLESDAYDMAEVIDINSKNVLFQFDEHFSWRGGGLSQDIKGIYSAVNTDGFAGIEYFDFETREYKTIATIDFGYLANLQLIY